MKKTTLVIGASEKPERYSNKAIRALRSHDHPVIALAKSEGKVGDVDFATEKESFSGVDTVTLYVSPQNQTEYFNYVLSLRPQRVIFNPGTENDKFVEILKKEGIQAEYACTLLLLAIGEY